MVKINAFEIMKEIVEAANTDVKDELIEILDKEIASLENKAAKAKERAAQKAAEGDELRAKVLSYVSDEPKTAADIADEIDDEEITKGKVTARLTQLVKAGEVEKVEVKPEKGAKKTAYVLAGSAPVEE